MKLFAYYLPQFHCIKENDEWWGKGFTEWVNVKKAKPLYKGHQQPKLPLNDNYYNLTDISTMKWQSKLMNEYKVDGLIFYHYYFTGKKLLEKPAEMLLKNPDVKMNFFFCWANHSWYRSWEGSKTLLMEQKYGKEKDWEKHFEYLLPFFKDKRYEKKDNKPLLMVFNSDFKEKKDMFAYFNKKCLENGFDGICTIETYQIPDKEKIEDFYQNEKGITTEFLHLREPGTSKEIYATKLSAIPRRIVNKLKQVSGNAVRTYDGNALFKLMSKNYYHDARIIRGLFFEWDNTPRHSYRGYVITPPNKNNFMNYMDTLKNEDYLFINAWNEWAEGMMLEPTIQNKYKYLEWIKEWKEK